jgi:hypothetical protein
MDTAKRSLTDAVIDAPHVESSALELLASLRRQVALLQDDAIGLDEAVAQVTKQLLVRAGETVTPELALERARNIIAGLVGLRVGGDQ